MQMLTDIHTHTPGRSDAMLSVEPPAVLSRDPMVGDTPFSLSLHPWHITESSISEFDEALALCSGSPMLMGIGECGLDSHCTTPLRLQVEAFVYSLAVAQRLKLMTIIHCVGHWAELQQCVRQVWKNGGACEAYVQGCPLVIHGFRKGPVLARQLVAQGFCLSLGEHFNPEVPGIVPPDRLFRESD
ncbi:MAG: TatD family hydrolase [Bacteroidales bacterium]|nr:TatD family hydrolase [Candidatus Liminaster caballi]